jgi:hypothetical protein
VYKSYRVDIEREAPTKPAPGGRNWLVFILRNVVLTKRLVLLLSTHVMSFTVRPRNLQVLAAVLHVCVQQPKVENDDLIRT